MVPKSVKTNCNCGNYTETGHTPNLFTGNMFFFFITITQYEDCKLTA